MPKKIEEVEVEVKVKSEIKQEVKAGLKAYAEFEFRGRQYKEGDAFIPDSDLVADANMDEFRRIPNKQASKGRAYYYEVVTRDPDKENEIYRVVLPVE